MLKFEWFFRELIVFWSSLHILTAFQQAFSFWACFRVEKIHFCCVHDGRGYLICIFGS
jgi:hypothetical protein